MNDTSEFLRALFLPDDNALFHLIHETETFEDKDGHQRQCVRVFLKPLAEVDESFLGMLHQMNISGWHVYVCMSAIKPQPGVRFPRRTKEMVAGVRAAYIDVDKDGPVALDEIQKAAAAGFVPAPHFIVNTSPGKFHVTWLLADGVAISEQESLNRALQTLFRADPAATDCTRVLRLPGFVNCKTKYNKPLITMQFTDGPRHLLPAEFKVPPAAAVPESSPIGPEATDAKITRIKDIVEAAMRKAGIDFAPLASARNSEWTWVWDIECPNSGNHSVGTRRAGLFMARDGRLGFNCFHGGCADFGWKWVREVIEDTIGEKIRFDPPEQTFREPEAKPGAVSTDKMLILPGGGVTIRAAAEELFKRIHPTKTMFIRGRAVVVLVDHNGTLEMDILDPSEARSYFEKYAEFWAWREGRGGKPVLKPAVIARDMAEALSVSEEARDRLPKITSLINCPVLINNRSGVQIIGKGHHEDTGLFITGGEMPPKMDVSEGVEILKSVFEEFDFQSPGDRSRGLASSIAPALKLGGHLIGPVPCDLAEADDSQSGKTYRQKLVAAFYNETPALVTCKNGGVGSIDESLNTRLIAGRPFIQLDNFRGKFDSPHVEALLTAERSFPARIPHKAEIMIDPSRFFLMLSSNGVDCTRDFANRGSIIRIRKRVGYTFKLFPEGDILDHVRANQPMYLGAIFSIIRNWIERGSHCTFEVRHDFREWAQTLDWIVQFILNEAPLMDGHLEAQERVSNSGLTFLRKLAIAVAKQDRLGEQMIASQLYEIAQEEDVPIPGLHDAPDEDRGKRLIGSVMGRIFKKQNSVTVDDFTVTRQEVLVKRDDGGGQYFAKDYLFRKQDNGQAQDSGQARENGQAQRTFHDS